MKIGFIGLGALGNELARRFLAHDLSVWDLNPAAAARLGQAGARVARSARDLVAGLDVLLICLPRSSDVRQLLFGADGIAGALASGLLVIDQTSGVPRETHQMAAQLAQKGVNMLDAPVSGSPHVVPQGLATILAAGPNEIYARALPILRTITQTVYHCGTRVGDGQALKMVNNAMNAGCRMGTLEAVAMGRKAGHSLEALTKVLNAGVGSNLTTERMLPAIAQGKSATNFALALMLKDINQAVTLGLEMGVPMPISSTVRSLLQIGLNTLGDDARLEQMIGVIESMAGIRFAAPLAANAPLESGTRSQDADHEAKLVDDTVGAICRHVTLECVAVGAKFGLRINDMSVILNQCSGWSRASRELLPRLASRETLPEYRVRQEADRLGQAATLAMLRGAPATILNAVRGVCEAAANQLAEDAGFDDLRHFMERSCRVQFN